MKKKLIFGGTFNPVHNGHIFMLEVAQRKIKPDEVIIIPNNLPPHKTMTDRVPAIDRYNMCRLAFGNMPNTIISDSEIKKHGVTYTVDTLSEFKKQDINSQLFFIVGSDMFLSFHTWHLPLEISSYATLCVVPRDYTDKEVLLKQRDYLKNQFNTEVILIDCQCVCISSTDIRCRIKHNKTISHLVPKEVEEYINKNNLYSERRN